jgi:hypothetical protein
MTIMDTTCTYHGNRDEILIAYLYGDMDGADREAYERHAASCAACRAELDELGAVRAQLARWTPPEPVFGVGRAAAPRDAGGRVLAGPPSWLTRLREIPVWTQVAAAALVLGASAGLANVRIDYNDAGLAVRTGWMAETPAPAAPVPANIDPAPWRVELAALEADLRREMRAAASPAPAAVSTRADAAETMRGVRALIEESEKRQQRELALRMAEIASGVRTQRVADLRTIESNLNATGVDMMRLYRMTNDLAVKVAQVR